MYVLEINLPDPNDIAIIMYTSGSTGVPKGVNLTHTNLIATLKAFNDAIQINPKEDVFMGYLPLAHVFELLGGNNKTSLVTNINFTNFIFCHIFHFLYFMTINI